MNLHLNGYEEPTVGVSFWVGDNIPPVELTCINNNARYFDEFYLICNREFKGLSNRVHSLIAADILEQVSRVEGKELRSLLPVPFAANYGSDMMTYFAKDVLQSIFNIRRGRVMYLDTDYVIYNAFMIKEIFNFYEGRFLLLKENNFYTRYSKDYYINACWSFDSTESSGMRLEYLYKFLKKNGTEHYACMGPHFTNREDTLHWAHILNSEPHTFDPRLITSGWNEIKMNPNSLGCHLALTLPREIGYQCTQINIKKPLIKLDFHLL